jgi:hypothetical protein
MKRLPVCLSALFILLLVFSSQAATIYLSTSGNDKNPGTKEQPLATLNAALRKARELRRLKDPSIENGIHIIISGGVYNLDEPVFIRPEDAGTKDSPTYIEAAANEQPVLSGGVTISNWKKPAQKVNGLSAIAQRNIWIADVPQWAGRPAEFRQLWINDRKAIRARDCNGDTMNRILSWDHANQQCWIRNPSFKLSNDPGAAEMFIHQWWAVASLRISKWERRGDSMLLSFHQPESRIQSEHPWPAPWISAETGNSAFYLTNSLPFLDSPGEWYLDIAAGKLYYWPRTGEDIKTAKAIVPQLETLCRIEGTIDHPVEHIYFNGISFQYSSWLRPSREGHVPHQAGMYMLDAYKLKTPGTPDKASLENQAWVGRPAAAVNVQFAQNVKFENCSFRHLASTGLDYGKATSLGGINGNLFQDIGGTAILAGVFSDEATEVHLPYQPRDERGKCSNLQITNNLINDVTNEDWGAVGIGAGYVNDISIEHNEIYDISYSGISMGWGWTKTTNAMKNNRIVANKIHHYGKHMYDVAAIYTLSAQPGSLISENYIDSIYKAPYAHIPAHWFYIYTDEGSSYINIKNNWTPSQKYLQNANGPGNEWTNNGPQVISAIKQNAGIQQAYSALLANKQPVDQNHSINKEHPALIELVTKPGESLDTAKLNPVLRKNKISTTSVYNWNDHYVVFGKVADQFVLLNALKKELTGVTVRNYQDPFYDYNRSYCSDTTTAAEWDHVLLTANLVSDKKLQQEYLDKHDTQFEKWPEISRGFCNASFQRLLIYRNGRQLMLVISIPKGKTLAELDPLTVKNNPRVDEWNKIMKKYQEGISGTKPGETWVFLTPLSKP